jgi:Holliday junction DNA helicase RuvA
MYEYISGKIIELNPTYLVIEAGQIGYNINISLTTYAALEGKSEAKIYVQHIVREDAQLFYGFADKREREVFNLLISVSGVGVNTARLILSSYTSAELANVIMSDDVVAIKGVKGIGLKTAQKIIIELKDKIGTIGGDTSSSAIGSTLFVDTTSEVLDSAVAALTMLGYTAAASQKVVKAIIKEQPSVTVEAAIKEALRRM